MKTLTFCLSVLLALGVGAEPAGHAALLPELLYDEPAGLAALPPELFYDIAEYLDYGSWLALCESLGRGGAWLQNAAVSKMVVLPAHAGKPVPHVVLCICAEAQQTARDTALVALRLAEVLEHTHGVRSLSLVDLPVNNGVLALMYRHAETLEQLALELGVADRSADLQPGWLRGFPNLRVLEYFEPRAANINFPWDFEPLWSLVCLKFHAFDMSLPLDAFWYMQGLRRLELQADDYSHALPPGIFGPLHNLKMLDLKRQRVDVLGPETLEGLISLETLVLPRDHFYRVDPGAFLHLQRLATVRFEDSGLFSKCCVPLAALERELAPMGFALSRRRTEFARRAAAE